jgi:hypothetical protein
MGSHAAPLRYVCPLFFIVVIQKILTQAKFNSEIRAALLGVIFTIILLLISPETSVANAFACTAVFLVYPAVSRMRRLSVTGAMLVAFGGVFWAASRLHILDTLRASGGGADSYPIYWAPDILLLFMAVFICASYLFWRLAHRMAVDNTFGIVAFSVPMIAAALGHCGPSHVFWNGEGLFLASMFYMSNSTLAWKWYKYSFVVVLIVLQSVFMAWYYSGVAESAAVLDLFHASSSPSTVSNGLVSLAGKCIGVIGGPRGTAKWKTALSRAENRSLPDKLDLSKMYPSWQGTFLAPFGYNPGGLGTYLSEDIDYGRYEGLENANTPTAIGEIVAEIQSHPERALLLPNHFEQKCKIDVAAERRKLSAIYIFPYFERAVHRESVRQPVCTYIASRYELEDGPNDGNYYYGLWILTSRVPLASNIPQP